MVYFRVMQPYLSIYRLLCIFQVLKYLLKAGKDAGIDFINQAQHDGASPLSHAITGGYLEVVR